VRLGSIADAWVRRHLQFSYYEEVLITRVHPELLERERLPNVDQHVGKHRFAERIFVRSNGIRCAMALSCSLHLSKEE
jgi:hypothetical protein